VGVKALTLVSYAVDDFTATKLASANIATLTLDNCFVSDKALTILKKASVTVIQMGCDNFLHDPYNNYDFHFDL
jgi:hypothetical protein